MNSLQKVPCGTIPAVNTGRDRWLDEPAEVFALAGRDAEICFCPIEERLWLRLTMVGLFGATEPQLPQCEVCDEFFNPFDMQSSNGEYLESCEDRTKRNGPFPQYLPKHAQSHPYTFCSEDCEREAIDQVIDGMREYRRQVEEGEIEDALETALPEPWWSQR
jgi:hypothetical protein